MAKVGFVSLGCPKNLVDSEVMLGILSRNGYQVTSRQEEADIIVVNTCGFIDRAKQESVDTILEMAEQKKSGRCRRLIVAGCLVERYRREIQQQIPEVDAVIGTNEVDSILQACTGGLPLPPRYENRELFLYSDSDPRLLTTPAYSAYIKVAEGCDHPCTFCVIPKMRGRFRSRTADSILAEANRLVQGGVKEINLVGQDTTMYGWDLGQRQGLADLIRRLGTVPGLQWVRFLYAYPNAVYDDLLRAIAETESACKYLDIPLQHASRNVLRLMKRGGHSGSLLKLIERIRSFIPGVVIRTTMIVGFPGETEDDFAQLLDFVRQAEFDRLGVFSYSDEEDSEAFKLGEKVPERVKTARRHQVMKLQAAISTRKNRALVGQTVPVLLEGLSNESDLLWQGRLSTQAPDIDGVVYINDGLSRRHRPGQLVPVRISEAHQYDLVGAVM